MKNLKIYCCAVLAVIVAGIGCSNNNKEKTVRPQVIPVIVQAVVEKMAPVQIRVIGTAEAYSTVSVKSQVGGELLQVHFKEGQDVKKNALLFTIDPRPYEAALKKAEAVLARDVVLAKKADEDVKRYAELVEKDYVTKEQFDQIRANADSLQATIKSDEASVESARLDLDYCSIYSPIEGRTGDLLIKQGNLVKANDQTALIVINQIHPLYVRFSIPEQNLPDVKKFMAQGTLKIEAAVPNSDGAAAEGNLSFVDNTIDTMTGTIMLKGEFDNKDNMLWPGLFVNVVLTLTQTRVLVIPTQTIQTSQEGQFVFVVKNDQTVESRPVTSGRRLNGEVVIESGLKAGELVVTDGQIQLVPGSKVSIKNSGKGGGTAQ